MVVLALFFERSPSLPIPFTCEKGQFFFPNAQKDKDGVV